MVEFDKELVREAKAIVASALVNGPLAELNTGMKCPTCSGEVGYCRITDEDFGAVAKTAVSQVFRMLWLRDNDQVGYQQEIRKGDSLAERWNGRDPGQP